MAGPMNQSLGGWQGYPQGQTQWSASPQQPQYSFGQNGGNMSMPQQTEAPFVGRFINQIEEVMPREVPMDGRVAIFPSQSLEEIYLKAWDRNGSIKTFRYVLDPIQSLNAQGTAQEPNMGSMILERLYQLEQRLNETNQKQTNRRNNSKGGEENA